MPRPTRTVDCPKCGTAKETRAFGGLALRCANPECRALFECPAKDPAEISPSTTEDANTTARASTGEDAPRGGVKVRRASGVKASPPPPPAPAEKPAQDPEQEKPPAARASRPRSHRRGWARS